MSYYASLALFFVLCYNMITRRSFNNTVDRMPLVGKYLLQQTMHDYIRSPISNERTEFSQLVGILGFFVVAHAYQAKIGTDAFSTHLSALQDGYGVKNGALMCFDAAYASVNAAVTLRQTSLLLETYRLKKRRALRHKRSQTEPTAQHSQHSLRSGEASIASSNTARRRGITDSAARVALAIFVTAGGQAGFYTAFKDAEAKQEIISCVDNANSNLESYAQDDTFTESNFTDYATRWSNYCDVDVDKIVGLDQIIDQNPEISSNVVAYD